MGREIKRSGKAFGFEGEKSDAYDVTDMTLREGLEAAYNALTSKEPRCDPPTLARVETARKKLDDLTDSEVKNKLLKDLSEASQKLRKACRF